MTTASFKITLLAALAPILFSTSVQARNEDTVLEEVTVTAQRREQNLQEVPISISAFSAASLEKLRFTNILDLGNMVPNLSAVEGAGGTMGVVYQIRGLFASGTALGADSGVATYLDGVYLKGGSGTIINFADIERVEVLRGPQGTLFGRNTSGGAIDFITQNPNGEFGFRQKLTRGNLNLFESKTRIDTPQWGPVSASLNYTHSERDGPVKNTGAGTAFDFTQFGGGIEYSPERLGDDETDALFLAIKLDLHEDLDLIYKYDNTESDSTPSAVGIQAFDPSVAGLTTGSFSERRPDSVANNFHLPAHLEAQGHNLTAAFSLSDDITLRNILSYRDASFSVPGQTLDGVGQFAPTVGVFVVSSEGDKTETSEEFQVIWDTDTFAWTTGYLYYALEQEQGGYKDAPNAVFGCGFNPPCEFPGTTSEQDSEVEAESNAVYSQFEYHLDESWNVIVGGRFTNDKKDYVDRTLLNATGQTIIVNYDEDEFTYLLGLEYSMTDDIMIFSKYSTGYISGGLVSGLAYDSEKAKSLELGMKANWFENSLQTNLSLFRVEYENQQFGTSGALVSPQVPAAQVLVNAGSTESQGFELETTWLPLPGTQLGLNVGYLDFDFKEIDLALLGGPISEQLRPQWTSSLTAAYETAPLFDNATMAFYMDAAYRSSEDVTSRPDAYNTHGTNPDVVRVGAQVALQNIDLAGGKVRLALWGRNLTDSDLPANMSSLGPVTAGTYEAPRTYGIDVTYEF